jgi:rhodanese-related sulfurtransferase
VDPLAHAANVLRNKRDGLARAIPPQQLKAKLDDPADPVVLLDVRTPPEREQMQLRDPRVVWIPLGQLRKRLAELPRDKEIVCFCKVSQRGYEAQRILDGAGFANVKFLDGGLVAWPYPPQTGNGKKEK